MPLPADYQKRSADEKLTLLWSEIQADPYAEGSLPTRVPGALDRTKLFCVDFNKKSFEIHSDELPADRAKIVHALGTSAKVTVKITEPHPYTGLFEKGGPAIFRASDALGGDKFLPSIALKFFVDGVPSVNLLALPMKAPPTKDPRFFASSFANATEPPTALDAKLVQWSFQRTANALGGKRLYAIYLPLHHIASIYSDGSAPKAPEVPDRIEFHPTPEATKAWTPTSDWRTSLGKIPAGTKLFDLRAAASIDAESKAIGELWLDSDFVASRYGDERLFFQHDVGPT